MIVMTMILTRLITISSGYRARSGINWAKQSRILGTAASGVKQLERGRLALKRTDRANRPRYRPSYLTVWDTSRLFGRFPTIFTPHFVLTVLRFAARCEARLRLAGG